MAKIDRRNFLGLFSAAALAAIAPIDRLVRLSQKHFESPAFAFSFDIPDGWCHWTVDDVVRNRELQVYVEDDRAQVEFATPLIAFSRYKEPHPDLNPGVCIYGDRRVDWMGDDVVAMTDSATEYFSTLVKDSRIIRPAIRKSFSGCDSAKSTLVYDLVCSNGFRHRVADDFLLAFHRDHLIFFQFEQSFAGPERAEKEFEFIERTLKFV